MLQNIFNEYAHDKVLMANKLSISEHELVQYLIEGIPYPNLQNQTRLHKFKTSAEILEAFEDVTLHPIRPTILRGVRSSGVNVAVSSSRMKGDNWREELRSEQVMCGLNHMSRNCSTKESGVKCFKCGERDHIVSSCVKGVQRASEPMKGSYVVSQIQRKNYKKEIIRRQH